LARAGRAAAPVDQSVEEKEAGKDHKEYGPVSPSPKGEQEQQ
jgi:hypothetical protein